MADAGDIIYIARRKAGISQSELARRSGISQATISAYESDKTSPAFETLEWLVAHCGMYLAVRLEAHVAPPLPDHPWAKGVEKLRDRIVHAVHEHGCHAPSIAPPAQALRKPVLLVSADAPLEASHKAASLQRALEQRMPRRFEVVCRDLLSRAKLRELAKVAVPLAHQLDGTTRRETRFLEFKQGAYDDDRWYGSVIDGIDERHRSGSFSTWRWLRPPGSRATSERWR